MEPLILESAAYNIGYALGQMIGVLILLAIPTGIVYAIYRAVKSSGKNQAQSLAASPSMPARTTSTGTVSCPECGASVPAGHRFCMSCGKQFEAPVP